MLKHAVFYFLFVFVSPLSRCWKSRCCHRFFRCPLHLLAPNPANLRRWNLVAEVEPNQRRLRRRRLLTRETCCWRQEIRVFTHQLREVGSWNLVIYRIFIFFKNTFWILYIPGGGFGISEPSAGSSTATFDSLNGVMVSHAWRLLDVGSNIHEFLGGGWISHHIWKICAVVKLTI